MYLGQHEEVSQGADDPAGGDQDDDESDEVVPARGSGASPTAASERGDGHYQSTENKISDMIHDDMWYQTVSVPSSNLFNSEGHENGVAELREEDEEEDHEVEAGVWSECFVGGAEPAEERERDEEDAPDQGQPEGAAVIQAPEQEAGGAEQVGQQHPRVHCNTRDSRAFCTASDYSGHLYLRSQR